MEKHSLTVPAETQEVSPIEVPPQTSVATKPPYKTLSKNELGIIERQQKLLAWIRNQSLARWFISIILGLLIVVCVISFAQGLNNNTFAKEVFEKSFEILKYMGLTFLGFIFGEKTGSGSK